MVNLSDVTEIEENFQSPTNWLLRNTIKNIETFARFHLNYWCTDASTESFNPVFDKYIKTFPLPIGPDSILDWFRLYNKYNKPVSRESIKPVVDVPLAYLGYAYYFDFPDSNSIGWFLGLLRSNVFVRLSPKERALLTTKEYMHLLTAPKFQFIEGIMLFEGKTEETILENLKEIEREYNNHILGKMISGRTRIDPEYLLKPARLVLLKNPRISQKDLVNKIGCDLRTFNIVRKNGGFPTYKAFKDSVIEL